MLHSGDAVIRGGYRGSDPMRAAPAVAGTAVSLAGGVVEIVSLGLDDDATASDELLRWLSQVERERASRFVFERDRRRFLVGRARLRQLLGSRLGVDPDAIELVYGLQGKPALARRFAADLRFNLSHAEGLAICGFAWGRDIGVDVERVRALRDADDIAARFFSRSENAAYRALAPRDKPLGFFNCWTRKEAFIKALGEGLSHPLDRFDVSLSPDEPATILRVGAVPGHDCGWRLESFSPAAGFVAALVTQRL